MEYKITNWNGKEDFELDLGMTFGELLYKKRIYKKELELNLKYQLRLGVEYEN